MLEEYEHAKARGAKIYAEVVGYGLSGDAYHVTAPHPEGRGAELAMRMALRKAGMEPADIDYINAHGTSTMADTIELAAAKRVLGDDLSGASMSSTKSAIGHLLGGAGAVEAIFCILAIPRCRRSFRPRRRRRANGRWPIWSTHRGPPRSSPNMRLTAASSIVSAMVEVPWALM